MDGDFEARKKAFLEGYEKLVKDCQVDWANFPVWAPQANGTWFTAMQSTLVDIKGKQEAFIPNSQDDGGGDKKK